MWAPESLLTAQRLMLPFFALLVRMPCLSRRFFWNTTVSHRASLLGLVAKATHESLVHTTRPTTTITQGDFSLHFQHLRSFLLVQESRREVLQEALPLRHNNTERLKSRKTKKTHIYKTGVEPRSSLVGFKKDPLALVRF